jgi:hypothetical protein
MEDSKLTTVKLLNRNRLWFLIPVFVAPFLGLFLYSNYNWWMSICLVIVGIIQLISMTQYYSDDVLQVKTHISKEIRVDQLDEYANKEKSLIRKLQVFAVIIGILDLFPFFCQFHLIPGFNFYYEGGIIVTLLSLILCGICLWCAYEIRNPQILENLQLYKSTGKTQEEKIEEEFVRLRQVEKKKQEQKQNAFGEGFIEIGRDVVINDKTKKIFINSHEYNFDDILEFSVQDNSVTIHTGSTSTAKTNTGSMIGRAAVGGVLFGGAGAVIGGATAKRDIYNSGSSSSVYHDYSVIITVNNITHPNETVKLGGDEETLNKITSTLTVILHNN